MDSKKQTHTESSDQRTAAECAPADERYQTMLSSAVDWLWETDARGRLIYTSEGVSETMGVGATALLGSRLVDLLADADAVRRLEQAMIEGRPFRETSVGLRSGDGQGAPFRLTGSAYVDSAGRPRGYRGTATAVENSDTQAAADTAHRLFTMLEEALTQKDQLEWELSNRGHEAFRARLAALAHELRTPLNAIIPFADAIRKRVLGDDLSRYDEYAQAIYEGGNHLLELINTSVELAHLEAQRRDRVQERIALDELVASMSRMQSGPAAAAGLSLINEMSDAPVHVYGESQAVRQIVLNLMTNAIKFNTPGGRVGIVNAPDVPDRAGIVISDTGVGIDEAEQEKIFEKHYRVAPRDATQQPAGSGLGLAISRELARAMGGYITVASKSGAGARFTLYLPTRAPAGPNPAS